MITRIQELLRNNQTFEFLWTGCSDSRGSPNLITGTRLGDMFVAGRAS